MLAHGQFLPRLAIDHRFQIQDLAFHLVVFLHHFVEVELEIKQILTVTQVAGKEKEKKKKVN